MVERVLATPAALALIERLVAKHGPVLFHQSGGCCDGSAPNCFARGEFAVAPTDVLLGEIGGSPVYVGGSHYDYVKHTQLIIDARPGVGDNFSLEGPEGMAFHASSRLFTDDEWAALEAAGLV